MSEIRELAAQISESFRAYGRDLPLRHTVIFGGVGQRPQAAALRLREHTEAPEPDDAP